MGSQKKQENSRKTSTSALLIMLAFDCMDHNNWKILKEMRILSYTFPASWETCMQVKKQQLKPDKEQWTSSKLGTEYVKAVYCHLAYLTYMKSTSCKIPDWMKHKLESRLLEKYQYPQICRWHHPYSRKWRGTKEPLDESETEEWKSWLKTQHSEN